MSEKLYFACDWAIRTKAVQHMWHVVDKALELGCTIFSKDIYENSQGIFVNEFFIETPSLDTLNIFTKTAGAKIGLITWYLVENESELEDAYNLELPELRAKTILGFEHFGKINDLRRKNPDKSNKTGFYEN